MRSTSTVISSTTAAARRVTLTASSTARGTTPFSRWKWSVRAEPVCSVVSAAARSPAACPAWVRMTARAYGFFFWGISALARLWRSASSTRPNSWLA